VTRLTNASERLPPGTALRSAQMVLLCTDGGAVYRWWGCVQMMLLCTDGGDGAVRRRVACCRFTDICDRRNAALFREKMEVVCASETSAKLHGVMPLT